MPLIHIKKKKKRSATGFEGAVVGVGEGVVGCGKKQKAQSYK